MKRLPRFLPLCALFLCSCVDVPVQEAQPARARAVRVSQFGIQSGLSETQTLHFIVRASSSADAERYGKLAEQDYEAVMRATGLYSFLSDNAYELVVYSTREEYLAKSGQPAWSAGTTLHNAIMLYDGTDAQRVLAHEMTHVIFGEFMGRPRPDLRWLNEGLAVYMETSAIAGDTLGAFRADAAAAIRTGAMNFTMLTGYSPMQDDSSRLRDNWYMQCESVVRYLLDEGGQLSFAVFLKALKENSDIDNAAQLAWRGKWQGLSGIEAGWRKANGLN
ncbi:MAG: hypothetical protein PHP45_10715 [Elusimicrobiales bacterium]|nr:hypothetical protein [Elusimicrobiales bacterium]